MTLRTVTKAEFMRRVCEGKLNVHPRPEREVTYWEFPNRTLFGTSPGYMARSTGEWRIAEHQTP